MLTYANRDVAGDELAAHVRRDCHFPLPGAAVLGLVRGGVPVAARVAVALGLALDALVIRKLGVPWSPEVAFGAIGAGGVVVHNPEVEHYLSVTQLSQVVATEQAELRRREALYRGGATGLDLANRLVLIVDDGLATGSTALAAVRVVRATGAARVVVAAPVGAAQALALVAMEADQIICPLVPAYFAAVGQWYDEFPQVSDEQVLRLLTRA